MSVRITDDPGCGVWTGLRVLNQARAWAFFLVDARGARLLVSQRIDGACLDDVMSLGTPLVAPRTQPPTDTMDRDTARSRLLVTYPHLAGPGEHGLLYLEQPATDIPIAPLLAFDAADLLAVLRACVGAHAAGLNALDLPGGMLDECSTLRVLLERHEWNVSCVARQLGLTRMTVYNRMRRCSIQRLRRIKTPRRKRLRPPSGS